MNAFNKPKMDENSLKITKKQHKKPKMTTEQTGQNIFAIFITMSGWPSGLRRQTQELASFPLRVRILVHECGRGFESHF